jgi:hypothetical protein
LRGSSFHLTAKVHLESFFWWLEKNGRWIEKPREPKARVLTLTTLLISPIEAFFRELAVIIRRGKCF